ncbi:MAG: hypothetical protein ACSHWU_12975 [Marinicella sp.]
MRKNTNQTKLTLLLAATILPHVSSAETVGITFQGTLGDNSLDTHWGEYEVGTPFCGVLIYESEQVNSGGSDRGDYNYEKLIVVFPDDSDNDEDPNYLVDYGNAEEDIYNGPFHVYNHLINDPTNHNSYPTDMLHVNSHGPANGLVINGVGSETLGGFSAGNPNDWDWAYVGINLGLIVQYTDGNMFPDQQGVRLPSSLVITEDSINPDNASSFLSLSYTNSDTPHDRVYIRGPLSEFILGPISHSGFDNAVPHLNYLEEYCGFQQDPG